MNIFVAGIGPGNYNLITVSAIEHAKCSDIIIIPRANINSAGMSEKVISHYIQNKTIMPIHFPMIKNEAECLKVIQEQLMRHQWDKVNSVFMPVIGDALLYSTGYYLVRAFSCILNDINVEFIPGISAHSLAASYANRFLAVKNEIFSVIAGTSERERILAVMKASDVIAIYKPRAIKNFYELVMSAGEFKKIIRVDYAGIPEKERISEGIASLKDIQDYMSIILLWKR